MTDEQRIEDDIARARDLMREDCAKEATSLLQKLAEDFPRSAQAQFEFAGALDFQGREEEAIEPYFRAAALGLPAEDVPRLHVQLGSTLRNVGMLDEAEDLLSQGRQQFPDYAAIQAFHALALTSLGRAEEAVATLLELLVAHAETIDLDGYQRALREYAVDLRESATAGRETESGT
jgi:predicted Zn-dependent protease